MSNVEQKINISFEEGWDIVKKAVKNILEGLPDPHFTSNNYMMLYTTIYRMCTQKPPNDYTHPLYDKYKEAFQDYINSTVGDTVKSLVLPSLREKEDELLLRELLVRWSNHKIMTRLLSRIFCYIDKYTQRRGLPSLEETGYSSFYSLVYDEMNGQVMDAILAMIDRKRAGEPIDETLVKNALTFYSEIGESTRKNDPKHFAETMIKDKAPFYYDEASNWIASSTFMDNTPKDEKMPDSTAVSSKKINLISSDGEVFEVNYDVAVMSKTIKDAIETNSAGDIGSISLSFLNSEKLTKVIEYCKKHSSKHSSTQMSDVDLMDWDAKFVEVDHGTLLDLVRSANYLNIMRLLDLACMKVADLIKGKSPNEIRRMFDIKEEDSQ